MSLDKLKKDWNELAELDPMWAILLDSKKKFNKWNVDEFFQSGEGDINELMEEIKNIGHPAEFKSALDFGCGIGRLTRPLAKNFEGCYGIDISKNMINQAKKINQDLSNCKFVVNTDQKLSMFSDNYFDLVYTIIVLQHIPDKEIIKSYLREFVRILKKDGLLAFQLPSKIPFFAKTQRSSMAYNFLHSVGINERFLFNKLGLHPISMNFIPEDEVKDLLQSIGAKILKIQHDSKVGRFKESRTYFVTK